MNAQFDYTSWAERQHLNRLHEEEVMKERIAAQIPRELAKRETWEQGAAWFCQETPLNPNDAITQLMLGDYHNFGERVYKYIVEKYAMECAEVTIKKQDEDAANDFLVD